MCTVCMHGNMQTRTCAVQALFGPSTLTGAGGKAEQRDFMTAVHCCVNTVEQMEQQSRRH